MGLRFPQGILFERATFSLNRASRDLVRTQNTVSSGLRVQTLSDDPSASVRILSLKAQNLDFDRFLETIDSAKILLDTAASSITSLNSLVTRAKEVTLQAANQTLSQEDRDTLADEIDGILSESLSIANTKVAGRFIFSGTKVSALPYTTETSAGETQTVYNGNSEVLVLNIGFSLNLEVTIPGNEIFQTNDRGATRFSGNTGAASDAGQDTGRGNNTLTVVHGITTYTGGGVTAGTSSASGDTIISDASNPSHTVTIDTSAQTVQLDSGTAVSYTATDTDLMLTNTDGDVVFLDTTGALVDGAFAINATGTLSLDGGLTTTAIDFSANQRIVDSVTGELVNVNSSGITRTGDEYITFDGTFDLFTILRNLRDDLRNTRNLAIDDQLASIVDRVGQLDAAESTFLKALGIFGERSSRLESTSDRLTGSKVQIQGVLSNLQDTDFSVAITDFAKAQANLEFSQSVTARVLQLGLVNFLS